LDLKQFEPSKHVWNVAPGGELAIRAIIFNKHQASILKSREKSLNISQAEPAFDINA